MPTVAEVAEIAGISVRSLQRELSGAGLSYSDMLGAARFEHAARLLRDSDAKMIEIGFSSGYTDPARFIRAFRRISGITPPEYRDPPTATSNAAPHGGRPEVPIASEVRLLGQDQSTIEFDAKVADGAFQFGMPERIVPKRQETVARIAANLSLRRGTRSRRRAPAAHPPGRASSAPTLT